MASPVVVILAGLALLAPTLVVLSRRQRHEVREIGLPAAVLVVVSVVVIGIGIAHAPRGRVLSERAPANAGCESSHRLV